VVELIIINLVTVSLQKYLSLRIKITTIAAACVLSG